MHLPGTFFFFFFNDTATTEIYTLSLHDALPIFTAYYLARRGVKVALVEKGLVGAEQSSRNWGWCRQQNREDRKSTRLNSSHANISYAVFCLKKKKHVYRLIRVMLCITCVLLTFQ